jgi:hypothetical protein
VASVAGEGTGTRLQLFNMLNEKLVQEVVQIKQHEIQHKLADNLARQVFSQYVTSRIRDLAKVVETNRAMLGMISEVEHMQDQRVYKHRVNRVHESHNLFVRRTPWSEILRNFPEAAMIEQERATLFPEAGNTFISRANSDPMLGCYMYNEFESEPKRRRLSHSDTRQVTVQDTVQEVVQAWEVGRVRPPGMPAMIPLTPAQMLERMHMPREVVWAKSEPGRGYGTKAPVLPKEGDQSYVYPNTLWNREGGNALEPASPERWPEAVLPLAAIPEDRVPIQMPELTRIQNFTPIPDPVHSVTHPVTDSSGLQGTASSIYGTTYKQMSGSLGAETVVSVPGAGPSVESIPKFNLPVPKSWQTPVVHPINQIPPVPPKEQSVPTVLPGLSIPPLPPKAKSLQWGQCNPCGPTGQPLVPPPSVPPPPGKPPQACQYQDIRTKPVPPEAKWTIGDTPQIGAMAKSSGPPDGPRLFSTGDVQEHNRLVARESNSDRVRATIYGPPPARPAPRQSGTP